MHAARRPSASSFCERCSCCSAARRWRISAARSLLARASSDLAAEMRQRLAAEQQLHRSQKLEALGRLAACMGHEINNPLSYVLTNIEEAGLMLAGDAPLGPAERAELCAMLEESAAGV